MQYDKKDNMDDVVVEHELEMPVMTKAVDWDKQDMFIGTYVSTKLVKTRDGEKTMYIFDVDGEDAPVAIWQRGNLVLPDTWQGMRLKIARSPVNVDYGKGKGFKYDFRVWQLVIK